MRWSWHEKPGVRKGPITRKSDRLQPADEERQDRERHWHEYEDQVLCSRQQQASDSASRQAAYMSA